MRARALIVLASFALASSVLAGCTLAPAYQRPAPPIPTSWPTPTAADEASAASLSWREVFPDTRLQGLIALALEQNRDLRIAVANIAKARAQFGLQRANLFPAIDASASDINARTPAGVDQLPQPIQLQTANVSVGFTAYELDVFGRIRSQVEAAHQSVLASEEDRRTAQISLIAEVAADYVTLASDRDLLRIDQDTLKTRENTEQLTRRRFESGISSQLDLSQAQTLTEQARTDVATASANLVQARNALRLVVGAEPPEALLPTDGLASVNIREDLPAGVPSDVLLRRPDVLSAEHALQAQNADIGAARAAFFPQISLTGSIGTESLGLGSLFAPGSTAWSFGPQITLPLFHGGANIANLNLAKADRDAAVAQYEKAIQTSFREVADTLAVRATIGDRLGSQQRLVQAAETAQHLSQARFERGVDSFLVLLDAQRTLFTARQGLLQTELTEAVNRIDLYKALGGGAEPAH